MKLDYRIRSFHKQQNRASIVIRMILTTFLLVLFGCNDRSTDPWDRYVSSIDEHIRAYVHFSEKDPQLRKKVLDDYERAKQIRDNYHRDGTIPNDPLVHVITCGDNYFILEDSHVGVFLAPDESLECSGLDFRKSDGGAGQFVVVGGNKGFWDQRSVDAKFISTTVTLPITENTLIIQSNSWSPGKIIIVLGVAVVLGLTGCEGDEPEPAATNPVGGCLQPSSPVQIIKGTLMGVAEFNVANSQDAFDYLTGQGKIAADAALATKVKTLSAGQCISPCIPDWNPKPSVTGRMTQVASTSGGKLIVTFKVDETSKMSCILPP